VKCLCLLFFVLWAVVRSLVIVFSSKFNSSVSDNYFSDLQNGDSREIVNIFLTSVYYHRMDELTLKGHIRKLKASDKNSFKIVVEHFHAGIFRFLVFKINDTAIAEDLLQDTFIRLWEKRETLEENLSIKSYLYTIASNLALNHIRHEKTVLRFKENLSREKSLSETPFEKLTQRELEDCIQHALTQMSDKVRIVFLMCKVEGLAYKEVAERLTLSVATVESHMVKALRIIREALDKHNG